MRILIVDDEKNIRRAMTMTLESMEHEVICASNSATALAELRAASFDVVLLDLKLSQESGLDVLEEILHISPQAAVVIMTAYASIETAVEAMRRGAFDYLPKPCTPEQVRQVLAARPRQRILFRSSWITATSPRSRTCGVSSSTSISAPAKSRSPWERSK